MAQNFGTLGNVTVTSVLYGPEEYKLALEFIPDADIYEGQLVKLVGATGHITPLLVTDEESQCIGMAQMARTLVSGLLVTVSLRGYAVINAHAGAATQSCGPVKQNGVDTAQTFVNEYIAAATTVLTHAWQLDYATDDNDEIRVLIKN